jgi:predicted TIM-barrel fold metal-dependent hydrolase
VFGGLTSVFTSDHLRFWHLRREQLIELVAQVGAERLIFGLDFPHNREEHTKTALETINGLGLSDADRAMILGGTLRRELGLE